jgi:hypothetical protein
MRTSLRDRESEVIGGLYMASPNFMVLYRSCVQKMEALACPEDGVWALTSKGHPPDPHTGTNEVSVISIFLNWTRLPTNSYKITQRCYL